MLQRIKKLLIIELTLSFINNDKVNPPSFPLELLGTRLNEDTLKYIKLIQVLKT